MTFQSEADTAPRTAIRPQEDERTSALSPRDALAEHERQGWLYIKATVMDALAPFPEALHALIEALKRTELPGAT